MIVPALVLAAALAQGTETASGARRNPVLEGVAVQAGEALVTLSELERVTKRVQARERPESLAEEQRQRFQILRDLWILRLEEQAGADLGLDPAQIGRISRADLQARRDKEGLESYLADLQRQGKDALADESDRKRAILRYLWERKALGEPFAATRATRDQTIRPGELRGLYEEHREKLAPPTVQLCWLIVSSAATGGPEGAQAYCEEARARVLAGEELGLFVEQRGAELRDTRGLTPFVPPQAIPDPALRAFAATAEPSELSEVLPLTNPRTGQSDPGLGYQLAQLRERRSPPVPEFSSPEVQRVLRDVFTQRRSDRILGRARERLRREAYSWVSPLIPRPEPAPEPVRR